MFFFVFFLFSFFFAFFFFGGGGGGATNQATREQLVQMLNLSLGLTKLKSSSSVVFSQVQARWSYAQKPVKLFELLYIYFYFFMN